MSSEVIPHTVEPHPITGLYNGKLGIWLFLASEVMLFGALFSAYIFLRMGNPDFGHDAHLNVGIGMLNTFILISSSVTMVMAWASAQSKDLGKARMYLLATLALAIAFLFIKITFEYIPKIQHGTLPSTSIFYGIYYVITGLHGLHVIGGIGIIGYLLLSSKGMWGTRQQQYTNRLECTGLYWHFVDLVWIFVFPIFYLLS